MDLYAAIDLRGGRCVRLYQGDFARETTYRDDPVSQAEEFGAAGAPWLHVVDLDASRGDGDNRSVIEAIAAAVHPLPVQAGGGVRDASLLDAGVARVVLGTLALADPDAAAQLITENPGRVAVGFDHRDGELRTHAWQEGSGVGLFDALPRPHYAGAAAFVVTDISRDATLEGPDVDGLGRAARSTPVPIVASGGVGSLDHLRSLRATGVAGAIVGKALYERAFTVQEAVAACGP